MSYVNYAILKDFHYHHILEQYCYLHPNHASYAQMQFVIVTQNNLQLQQKSFFSSIMWHHPFFKIWSIPFWDTNVVIRDSTLFHLRYIAVYDCQETLVYLCCWRRHYIKSMQKMWQGHLKELFLMRMCFESSKIFHCRRVREYYCRVRPRNARSVLVHSVTVWEETYVKKHRCAVIFVESDA